MSAELRAMQPMDAVQSASASESRHVKVWGATRTFWRPAFSRRRRNASSSEYWNIGGPAGRSGGGLALTSSRAASNTPCILFLAGRSHQANAHALPALTTRAHSLTACGGSGKCPMPKAQTTASKLPSPNGMESTLPSRKVHSGFNCAASSSMRGAMSIPVTDAPRLAASFATTPEPHATSSTRLPARTLAADRRGSAACSVTGAKRAW